MYVALLRIAAGFLTLPFIGIAALTFMASPKSLVDLVTLYGFWLLPALSLSTACGLWWTMPTRTLVPVVMVLPIVLWLVVVGLAFAIATIAS